ncbi:MAG: HEAT repeat domain-containing protein [Bacteroidota bacterium]
MIYQKKILFNIAAALVVFFLLSWSNLNASESFFPDIKSKNLINLNIKSPPTVFRINFYNHTSKATKLITEQVQKLLLLKSQNNHLQSESEQQVELTSKPDNLFDRILYAYENGEAKVRILMVLLAYLIISLLVLFAAIIINRYFKSRKRQKIQKLKQEYQEKLASFLFDDETMEFRADNLHKPLNREILTDEIRELHSNLHGTSAVKLRDLYFNLGLHKDSLKRVYSKKWYNMSKGLKEISQMDVKDANDHISQFVDHKNPILRTEAQIAMVKLAEDNPLGFLNNLKSELSYWEQINIFDTLNFHQISIESFEPWLESENDSVVVFALRMIGLFKQINSASAVKELLMNENDQIRLQAVKTLGELELPDYIADLKLLYERETQKLYSVLQEKRDSPEDRDIKTLDDILPRKIRYEIIVALSNLATSDDLVFLKDVATDYENAFRLRIKAMEVILSIKPEGEQMMEAMQQDADELLKTMINNVKQKSES